MDNKNLVIPILVILILNACSSSHIPDRSPNNHKNTNAFNILINQISGNIQSVWGINEVLIAGPKDYVKYSPDQITRVHINFVSGTITIETLATEANTVLKQAIVSTLLLPEPSDILSSSTDLDLSRVSFLYKQVVDHTGQPIRWKWRANHFADYLLQEKTKIRLSGGRRITYVKIRLVPNHVNERVHKFLPIVEAAAKRYGVEKSLILAIIKIESNYNPYAISRSDALGLMQIQQHTAGRDLYRIWGKSGEPSRATLLNPRENIHIGSAYLALIRDRYLAGIRHPLSMKYAMIAAYNGGAGSVLMTFSKDRRRAVSVINSLTPAQVYRKLTSSHASPEARSYLIKVRKIING